MRLLQASRDSAQRFKELSWETCYVNTVKFLHLVFGRDIKFCCCSKKSCGCREANTPTLIMTCMSGSKPLVIQLIAIKELPMPSGLFIRFSYRYSFIILFQCLCGSSLVVKKSCICYWEIIVSVVSVCSVF